MYNNIMEYNVEISYKHVKYLRMKVVDGIVKISCPFLTSKRTIENFIYNNKDYIDKKIEEENNKAININDQIVIFNKKYTILSTSLKPKITEHFIFVNEDKDIKKQLKALFKNQLLEYMTSLSRIYYEKMNLNKPFPKISIKDVKTRWGSYNKRSHTIVYASELIFKSTDVYDYLVVHELSHIIYFDHSKNFYNHVSLYCPNYKKLRKQLKDKE